MLATPFAEGAAFLKTATTMTRPDIQLHFVISVVDDHARRLHLGYGYSCHVCALRPYSRGEVFLRSGDPQADPGIDTKFLSDRRDLDTMIAGAKMTCEILQAEPLGAYAKHELFGLKNDKRFTSELGAVCPMIVVAVPWTDADLKFQAEHIATHKLHNSGFNCVACQVLIMPKGWDKAQTLLANVDAVAKKSTRGAYYSGATDRLDAFKVKANTSKEVARGAVPSLVINAVDDSDWFRKNEVFAPAMSTHDMDAPDAETYL